jgi:hypothetical protein
MRVELRENCKNRDFSLSIIIYLETLRANKKNKCLSIKVSSKVGEGEIHQWEQGTPSTVDSNKYHFNSQLL